MRAMRAQPIENPIECQQEITFSHPSEKEFACILDFYGIEWRYEPTTFPLEWDEEGNVLAAFSPDFYLVQQDLYVELTTLRQKLMRFKHRKIRRLRELYPEVKIRLWNRKDYERFLQGFGIDGRQQHLLGQEAIEHHDA
jgi:hypothetical protein